jgi:Tol biopolymer transport system component
MFSSARTAAATSIYEMPANGATPEQILLPTEGGFNIGPQDVSSDGKVLVFGKGRSGTRDLWVLPLSGDRKPFPYLATAYDEWQAKLSPNGRWLAYATNESGDYQVIVRPFPDAAGGKFQISPDGGSAPRWRKDGRELYYVDSQGRIVAVPVSTDAAFRFDKPMRLVNLPSAVPSNFTSPYDAAADGQRFLLTIPTTRLAATDPPLIVTLNWATALK